MVLLLSSQFNDIDHLLEHIKIQMDTDAVQLEAGPIQMTSRIFLLDNVATSQ